MKNLLFPFMMTFLFFLTACSKNNDMHDQVIDMHLDEIENSYQLARHYNDSLMQCNQYLNCPDSGLHYDRMFHHCDSTFRQHNNNMQNCCNGKGGGGHMNGGKGGMMNNNQTQQQNHCNDQMQQLRQQHQKYCTGK